MASLSASASGARGRSSRCPIPDNTGGRGVREASQAIAATQMPSKASGWLACSYIYTRRVPDPRSGTGKILPHERERGRGGEILLYRGAERYAYPGGDSPVAIPEDIIYHKSDVHQGFHVLTSNENVMVYTPTTDDGLLEMSSVSYNVKRRVNYFLVQRQLTSSSVTHYLVESRGKLLMVLRYYNVRRGEVWRTIKFRIFEMKLVIANGLSKASWVELVELTGRALFLGRGCSRIFKVSQFNRLQEGSIYYLDDTRFNISVALSNASNFSSADMGMNIYGMLKTRAGVRKFPRRFTSESSPPIWFVPESIDTVVS